MTFEEKFRDDPKLKSLGGCFCILTVIARAIIKKNNKKEFFTKNAQGKWEIGLATSLIYLKFIISATSNVLFHKIFVGSNVQLVC